MGTIVGVGGLGEGGGFSAATSLFSLLGALVKGEQKKLD